MKHHMKHRVSAFWFLLGNSLRSRSGASDSGFTLIESLVAIIVISVTVVAISPPIFWAAATRVQNRRAEQALSIAQGSIDQVRGKIERGGATARVLPVAVTSVGRPNPPAPTATAQWEDKARMQASDSRCNTISRIKPGIEATETTAAVKPELNYPPDSAQYIPVDVDVYPQGVIPDCEPDFLVQIFRNHGVCLDGPCVSSSIPADERKPLAFSVGVRVYSALAKKSTIPLQSEKARLAGTTGTGQTGFRPLAVLYSTVVKSDSSNALYRYRDLCNAGSDKTVCE
jgi:prepilin-type N-terminal cleavage/methylation domain-containing protein